MKNTSRVCVQKNLRERKDEKWTTKGEKGSEERRTKAEESEEWKSVDDREERRGSIREEEDAVRSQGRPQGQLSE